MEGEKSIGAIWIKTAKSGKPYMTGNIEINGTKIDIVVFSNDKGGNDSRPDYRIFKSEKKPQQGNIVVMNPSVKPQEFTDEVPW